MSWFFRQNVANKIAVIGILISAIALGWSIFSQLSIHPTSDQADENRVNQTVSGNFNHVINTQGDVSIIRESIDPRTQEINDLMKDLSKIELALPQNVGLNACIDSQIPSINGIENLEERIHSLIKVHSNCQIQLEQQGQAPAYLLARNKSILQEMAVDEPEVVRLYDDIHYFIAEIENNIMIDRIWRLKGCSTNLWFVENFDRERYNPSCIAAITEYSVHQDREKNDNSAKSHTDNLGRVAGTKSEVVNKFSSVSIVNANQKLNDEAIIVSRQSLNDYTVEHNEHAYNNMINAINGLREIVFEYRKGI